MVLKFYRYPNKFLSLIKISIMVGLFLFLPLNTRSLFAEKKSNCSLAPSSGSVFKWTGPDSWELSITLKKYIDNDKFLTEKIGLLKLKAAEEFSDFFSVHIKEETIEEVTIEEDQINQDFNEVMESFSIDRNFDWNGMKPILISMKSFHCYDDDQIVFSGKWTSNSLENAYRHINLEKAWQELLWLDYGEDSIFEDKMFNKKFPKLDETDDPEYIRNAITYIKKVRGS